MSRVLVVAALIGALVAALLPAYGQEQPPPRVTEIVVQGNVNVSTDQITPAITSKVGEPYSAEQAERDRQAVLALGWFYPVEVSAEPLAEGMRLIFRVQEKMVIKDIVFEGNTVFTKQQLLAVMETKPGTVLNDNTLNRDLAAIEKKYIDAGYSLARVLGKPEPNEAAGSLTIRIAEGEIGAIRVVGTRKTKPYVILREIKTKPGDIYDRNRIQRDLERLANTDLFTENITASPEAGALGKVNLIISVEEKKTGIASVGLAYSSVQKVVGFADVAEANLGGTAQRVSVRGEFGGRNSYELGYFNPWFAANHTSLGVNLYNKVILREAFGGTRSLLYDEKRIGGNLTMSRPLTDNTRLYGTLRVDEVSTGDTGELAPTVLLRRPASVRSIGTTLISDTRNFIAEPSRGGFNSASVEVAGLIGGARFTKLGGDLRRYWAVSRPAGRPRVVALRLMGGVIAGSPPALEQFLMGGGETLRGYRNDRFPGVNMTLMNLEYRIPLGSKLSGVLFADGGDAWGGDFAKDFGDTKFKFHLGYGVGVRIGTPIGQIRLDFGISPEGNETHFSVGHAF